MNLASKSWSNSFQISGELSSKNLRNFFTKVGGVFKKLVNWKWKHCDTVDDPNQQQLWMNISRRFTKW